MPADALDLAALDALAEKAARTWGREDVEDTQADKNARVALIQAASPQTVKRLIAAIRRMAGLISTMPQYAHMHPEDVLRLMLTDTPTTEKEPKP